MAQAYLGTSKGKKVNYPLDTLTRHAAVLGTTGSGKTVMCKVLVEEALAQGIPVIAIDPKGDIGGLGIYNEEADFRPFVAQAKAAKVSQEYRTHWEKKPELQHTTTIFTPKSSVGVPVSLLPRLDAPTDPSTYGTLAEPISDSILEMAGVKGPLREKATTLLASILVHQWTKGITPTFETLVEQMITPPLERIGSLALDDFLKENERRKIASSINLILTSASKHIWKEGKALDIQEMFKPNKLSIFDLRFAHDDKQFVVEQLLQEIYRFLITKGGTEKLRYILYIDELAGLLPPPPSNPPCKKMLELLIRQARAFGLGIILATQNPGDIDYRILGNVGTRCIGKLRTDNDVAKVASATDMGVADLKKQIATISQGQFIFNNAITNSTNVVQTRWLYTYHGGPLQQQEIQWVNTPSTQPQRNGSLNVKEKKPQHQKVKNIKTQVSAPDATLHRLKQEVRKYADTTEILFASKEGKMIPHLRVQVELKPFKGLTPEPLPATTTTLSKKKADVPNTAWITTKSEYFDLAPVLLRAVKKSIDFAFKETQKRKTTIYYTSPMTDMVSTDHMVVQKHNYQFLRYNYKLACTAMDERTKRKQNPYENKIKRNNQVIIGLRTRIIGTQGKRIVTRLFSRRKMPLDTRQVRTWKKKIIQLQKRNKTFKTTITQFKLRNEKEKRRLHERSIQKAKVAIRQTVYRPMRKDVRIHAKLLLVPQKTAK